MWLNLCQSVTLTVSLLRVYTVSQKRSHLWLAITLTHMNGF